MKFKIAIFVFLFFIISTSSFNLAAFGSSPSAETNQKKIVLVGSSFIRSLDSQEITSHLKQSGVDSHVYHLGVDMDLPSRRLANLDDVLSLKPDLVVYGIGYRIGINDGTHDQKYGCEIIHSDDATYSKILTQRNHIDDIYSELDKIQKEPNSNLQLDLQKYKVESLGKEPISPINIINLREDPSIDMCKELLSNELANTKEILGILNKNGIKTLIFITPHPKAYLDRIPDYSQEYFNFMIQSIGYEFNVDVYNISHKYEEQDIYRDFVHVARNPQSWIYSDDVAEMILDTTDHNANNDIGSYKVDPRDHPLLAQWCEENTDSIVKFSCNVDQTQSEKISMHIPSWIKNTAGWWANGQIDDSAFIQAVQFLIKEGIVVTPTTSQGATTGSNQIPPWIKNTAGWWANGQIDDSAFIQSIQFLIKEGML